MTRALNVLKNEHRLTYDKLAMVIITRVKITSRYENTEKRLICQE